MDLVVHQVVQLHRVHVADGDGALEGLAGAAVVQAALSGLRQFGLLQQCLDLSFGRSFEYWARHPQPEGFGGPAEVGLEDLPDIHPGGDAQRVEHHFHRRAVRQIGHVFLGQNARHDALIPVPARHLVADGDLALHRDVDFDELDDAGRQLIAAPQSSHFLVIERL